MLPSLCRAMAVNRSVSRFGLGRRAVSWQHQCLNCGTLVLSVPGGGPSPAAGRVTWLG
jgi:hypothetical protein